MKEETKQKINDLDEALKASNNSSALQVDDICHAVEPHLFGSTKELLKNKVTETADRDYQVRYIGLKAPTVELFAAGKKLAKLTNEFCGAYQIKGQLGKFIKLDLYFDGTGDAKPMAVYLAYIAVTHEAARVIDQLIKGQAHGGEIFEMGGIPNLELSEDEYESGVYDESDT